MKLWRNYLTLFFLHLLLHLHLHNMRSHFIYKILTIQFNNLLPHNNKILHNLMHLKFIHNKNNNKFTLLFHHHNHHFHHFHFLKHISMNLQTELLMINLQWNNSKKSKIKSYFHNHNNNQLFIHNYLPLKRSKNIIMITIWLIINPNIIIYLLNLLLQIQ